MSRYLARYVIPDYAVAIGKNVTAASHFGRYAVDGIHPAARAAMLLLSQAADSCDIRAIRRAMRIHGKAQSAQGIVDRCTLVKGEGATRRHRIAHSARCDRNRHRDVARLPRAALIARRGAATAGCRPTAGRRASARRRAVRRTRSTGGFRALSNRRVVGRLAVLAFGLLLLRILF